ncbi:XdhC family protein [Agromyces sp. MMS24-JH15]|uniref:XdhC family protein n=1 Tax=Agromyces sp. MMS24-JH15 TaxID=3243765 RepID=UPI00374822F0
MLELATEITARLARGERFAIATVTAVEGSAPRDPGASMLVGADGRVVGSVSGGCVEAAVHELCERVLAGSRAEHGRFGIDDDSAYAVGLSCGGEIDVFVQEADPGSLDAAPFARALAGASSGLATVVGGPAALVGRVIVPGGADPLTDRELRAAGVRGIRSHRVDAVVAAALATGRSGQVEVDCGGETLVLFCETRLARPRLLVFGAVAFAEALSAAGALAGYRVTVCDPRPAFATAERFPAAAEVVVEWPSRYLARTEVDHRTVVCVLGHDAKTDIPLLAVALALPVGYVGALGSRRTHAERVRMLRAAGVPDADLARLRSPIGLDLGAVTPAETAISILAEVIAVREGRDARPLRESDGPIHARRSRGSAGADAAIVAAADLSVDRSGVRIADLPGGPRDRPRATALAP